MLSLQEAGRLVAFGALALVSGLAATARAQSAPDTQPATQPEYRTLAQRPDRLIVELPNRMIVIAQEIPTAPVASAQVWVKTGSIYEQEHVGAGLSHFLEHLLSGGTTSTRTEAENSATLGRIGAQTNAATSLDTVRYYIDTSSEYVETAVDLLSDWMQNAQITQAEFDRERDVIQREFEMGQAEPGRIFWKLTQAARYAAHPARHPTIGYLDEFRSITRDEIYDFYKRMYAPNNLVFVVSGDIDKEKVVDQIAHLWKDAQTRELPQIKFPEELPPTEPKTVVGHADIDRPRLRLSFPGTRLAAPGDYALDLLAQVLGQGELSRLTQSVRNEQQLVTSVVAYNASFSWGEGFFGIDAVTTADKLDDAREAILDQIARIRDEGVNAEELDRAKSKTVARVVYDAQTAHDYASRLAGDFITTGDPDYLHRYAQAIQEISAEEVQEAARKFLQPERMTTIKLLPLEGESKPLARPADEVNTEDLAFEQVDLDNARLIRLFQKLQAHEPAGGAEVEISPIRQVTLPNGLRVLIQRNTRLPIVAMQWYQLGGLLADQPGQEGVANAMAQMLIKGAGERSANDIARQLEDLGASLSTDAGNSTFYANALSLAKDWPTVLALTSDVILQPTFAEDQWQRLQPRLLAAIDSINDSWSGQLRAEFREAYFGDYPWSQLPLGRREVVESLTAEEIAKFHGEHLSASDSVLAIFGDVDPEQVEQKVRELFADMPAKPAEQFLPGEHGSVESRIVQVETSKPLAAVQIGFAPGMARDNPDYAAMLVMTRVLSNFPVGWLEQALRGQGPGLVYAVGAGQMTGYVPGYWAILFNTQPQTASEATRRAFEVVDRIRTQKVDEETLQRARTAVLVGEALALQSNSQRASDAALNELYGVGYENGRKLIEQIREVTADDVKDVAERYLAKPLVVILTNETVDEAQLSTFQTEQAASDE